MSQIPTSTSTEFVLDTNVAIEFLNAPDAAKAKLGASAVLLVPVTVFGELYRGARKSSRVESNLKRVDDLATAVRILSVDLETARQFGVVQHSLRVKGKPLPQNDIWIASAALRHERPLVTRDLHFQHVEGLTIVSW